MSHISFIDCYSETPVITCFNDFITRTKCISTYHMASQFGLKSLEVEPTPKAYVILGSASHVNQRLPWHKDLAIFIDQKLKLGIPVLGICFGHQLMADFYGCNVGYIDEKETSYKEAREIYLTDECYGIKKDSKLTLAYCHSQIVIELSKDFKELAYSNLFNNEIIKHNTLPFIGTQAHPEASMNFLNNETNASDELKKIAKSDGDKYLDHFILSLK